MKRLLILIMMLLIGLGAITAEARVCPVPAQYGAGVFLGWPSGLTGIYWLNNKEAYDLSVGLGYHGVVFIQGDYLYHNYDIIKNINSNCGASLYYGGGLSLTMDGEHRYQRRNADETYDNLLGLKGTVCISYFLPQQPFELYFEISPIVNIIPVGKWDFDAVVGTRYMF